MSRPTLFRCAGLVLALIGTALVVAWAGARSATSADALSASTPVFTLESFTLLAWPLVQGVLSP